MRSGGAQKTLPNRSEDALMLQVIVPFVATGVVTANWGTTLKSYQVHELKVYRTDTAWDKKFGSLADFIGNKRNQAKRFCDAARKLLAKDKPRIFMVTPIQGSKHGDQEQQRILKEYDDRFSVVEDVVSGYGGVAIRIDREQTLDELVSKIKKEIKQASFFVADLTDERQSCYFECGYAEALEKPIIYVASQNSVMKPGNPTKIHFDIHRNIQFFTNVIELRDKLSSVIEMNKLKLFASETETSTLTID